MVFKNDFGNCECGLIYDLENLSLGIDIAPVPLKRVTIESRIVEFSANVTVIQEYENKESQPIEARYMFPVEEAATVNSFEAEVDGRVIKTIIKEKDAARKDYEDAIKRQKTAFLAEEVKNDIFKIKVGQLKPGSSAKITLSYLVELPIEGQAKRLTIPTTIAPRYVPPTDKTEEANEISNIKYSSGSSAPLEIKLEAIMKGRILDFSSPSHNLCHEDDGMEEDGKIRAKAKLIGTVTDMDRDFIVLIESKGSNEPIFFLETNEENGSKCGMVSMIPSFSLKEQKTELIFLVDRSGSMSGSSIKQASKALDLFMHSLPVNCVFNIFSFGSHFSSLFEESVEYTDDTLSTAKSHIMTMEANYGGTEIFKPLQHIFKKNPAKGFVKQIFVLTDGAVSNDDQVINLVRKNSDHGRLFSLGLGNSCSRHLVKGIARAGNGTSLFPSTSEDLRPKVLTLLKNALQPAIADITVTWLGDVSKDEGLALHSPELEKKNTLLGYMKPKADKKVSLTGQAPLVVPPIFDGSRLLVYRLFDKKESPAGAKITAETPDGPLSVELPLKPEDKLEGFFIHQLAARKKIQDLEEATDLADDQLKKAIVSLGTQYHLASKYTSFVGIDPQQPDEHHWGLARRDIANQFQERELLRGARGVQAELKKRLARARARGPKSGVAMSLGAPFRGMVETDSIQAPLHAPLHASLRHLDEVQFKSRSAYSEEVLLESNTSSSEEEKLFDSFAFADTRFGSSARSAMNKLDKNVQSSEQLLSTIIGLQTANGTFKWGNCLEKAFKMTEKEVVGKNPGNCEQPLWITSMVMAYFEVKMAEFKELWELVIDKSRKLLAHELGAEKAEEIVSNAKQYFL